MADVIKTFDKTVDNTLQKIVSPSVVKGFIHLLLTLYAVRLAPELPVVISNLFTNQYFRLLVFSLILWIARFSPSTAILMSLAFMITVNYATNKPLWEFLENVESEAIKQETKNVITGVESELTTKASSVQPVQSVEPTDEVIMNSGAPMAASTPEVQGVKLDTGCYPVRRYDMSQVVGYEM